MKNPFKKRESKSKEQIAWEMKQKADAQRKRKFVGEHFFPMLLEHLKTVTQAKNFCKVVQNDIMSTFNQGMIKQLAVLNMTDRFKDMPENEASKAYTAVLEIFKDMPIGETLELLDGMPNAIDAALNASTQTLPLSDLEWGDGSLTLKKND